MSKMGDSLVTLTCPNHHRTLTEGLCRLLAAQRGMDCRLTWGGRSLPVHRLMVDLFLSVGADGTVVHYELPDRNTLGIQLDSPTPLQSYAGQADCPLAPLKSVLEFMYSGRTIVPQSELELLLDVAKELDFEVLSRVIGAVRGKDFPRQNHRKTRSSTKVSTGTVFSNRQNDESTATYGRTLARKMATAPISDIVEAPNPINGTLEEEFLTMTNKIGKWNKVSETAVNCSADEEHCLTPANQRSRGKGKSKISIREEVILSNKGKMQNSDLPATTSRKSERSAAFKTADSLNTDSIIPCNSVQTIKPKGKQKRKFVARGVLHKSIAATTVDACAAQTVECPVCHKSFVDDAALTTHRCLHSGSAGIHECPHCPYKSRVRIWYQIHLAKHDPSIQLFRCGSCTRKFLTGDDLAQHQSSHDEDSASQLHQCPHCQRQLRCRKSYNRHVARHDSTVKVHRCDDCGQTFFARESLARHKLDHKSYACGHCDYVTRKIWSYYGHLFSRHQLNAKGETVSRLRCDQCDTFSCKTKARLRYHMVAKHSGARPFHCCWDGCLFASGYKGDVQNHVKAVHLKIRAHLCQECGTRLVSRSALERHLLSHSGARSFTCDVCGQAYRYLSTLRAHARRHGPQEHERTYVCYVCSHAFDRRHNLKVHLQNVHKLTGEAQKPEVADRTATSDASIPPSVT